MSGKQNHCRPSLGRRFPPVCRRRKQPEQSHRCLRHPEGHRCAPGTPSFTRTGFRKREEREQDRTVVLLARQPCFSCISEIKGELFHHPRKFTGREHPSVLFHMAPTCLRILNLQHSGNKNQTQKSRNPERLSGLSESSALHTPSHWRGCGGRTVQRNSEVEAQGFYLVAGLPLTFLFPLRPFTASLAAKAALHKNQ